MTRIEEYIAARPLDDRHCANQMCGKPVRGREFVLAVTTRHLYWFCSIECVVEGKQAHEDHLYELAP